MQSGDDKVSDAEELTPLQKSLLPPKPSCLGCRSHFVQHEKLPLENIAVEFKNYNEIPLKEPKHKLIILKTITAFLNTKGGAIYLGVEDGKCEVVGNVVSKPRQQEFRGFIAELLLEIYPRVERQDVKTFFIPILKRNGIFTGKYVTKVLVSQGQLNTFYTFAERTRLVSQRPNEGEEFEERIGYIRLGPGGLEKVEGEKLYDEVYKKAKDPHDEVTCHEGCNPEALEVVSDIKILGFRIAKQKQCQISNLLVKSIHDVGKADYSEHFDESLGMMIVEFESSVLAEVMRDKVEAQQKRIMNEADRIKYEGIDKHMFIFGPVQLKETVIKERKEKRINDRNEEKRIRDEAEGVEQKKEVIREKDIRGKEAKEEKWNRFHSQQPKEQPPPTRNKKTSNCTYVFTHLKVNEVDQFMSYLAKNLPKGFRVNYHMNSVSIKVSNEEELELIKDTVRRIKKNLYRYGHNELIRYGLATGHINIYNYCEKDREAFRQEVYALLTHIKSKITFKVEENSNGARPYMDVEVGEEKAAEALDILLMRKEIRKFRDQDTKLKFMLQCE